MPEFNLRAPKIVLPKLALPQFKGPGAAASADFGTVGISDPDSGHIYYVIRRERARFYLFSPQQPMGPDDYLARGTLVQLVRSDKGWADVQLPDGRVGTVGTDSLRLAGGSDVPGYIGDPSGIRGRVDAFDPALLSEDYLPPPLPGGEGAEGEGSLLDPGDVLDTIGAPEDALENVGSTGGPPRDWSVPTPGQPLSPDDPSQLAPGAETPDKPRDWSVPSSAEEPGRSGPEVPETPATPTESESAEEPKPTDLEEPKPEV
ncbi:MAG TPA: hypothetical protein VMN36_06685 [Verrucomicrobiales bacterium]|nr:hypothetical protein [Verrucomicrobiales bacterium]